MSARRRPSRGGFTPMPRRWLLAGGFLAFCAALLVLVVRLLAPFASALLWAAVLTIMVFPIFRWLLRLLRGRRTLAAGLTTVLLALAILGPAGYFATVLARESRDAYEGFREALHQDAPEALLHRLVEAGAAYLPDGLDAQTVQAAETELKRLSTGLLASVSAGLSHTLNSLVANATKFVVGGFVALLAVFYFLRDGEAWLKRTRAAVPLSPRIWDLVMERFAVTLTAVVHGMLTCAAILAVLLAIGYKVAGVPLPAFFGMITFFTAPIPFVGVLIVFVPAVAWVYVVQENAHAALGLLAFGAVAIFAVDNLLRPAIIGSIARLPVFFMLIAILGGLLAYGPLGLFLGPVLLAVAIAIGGVFREITTARAR